MSFNENDVRFEAVSGRVYTKKSDTGDNHDIIVVSGDSDLNKFVIDDIKVDPAFALKIYQCSLVGTESKIFYATIGDDKELIAVVPQHDNGVPSKILANRIRHVSADKFRSMKSRIVLLWVALVIMAVPVRVEPIIFMPFLSSLPCCYRRLTRTCHCSKGVTSYQNTRRKLRQMPTRFKSCSIG